MTTMRMKETSRNIWRVRETNCVCVCVCVWLNQRENIEILFVWKRKLRK